VNLIVQPEDGVEPILKALGQAKKSIQIMIFRIDLSEIERALTEAVERGVSVHALVAFTNSGGFKSLRRFEARLLEKGVSVTRTADDLLRYHGKMFIIDRKELYVLAFNFSHMDVMLSRSFAVSTQDPKLVREAVKLFECDAHRKPYKPRQSELVVSPVNAREQLANFISGAKKHLLIYDMKITDRAFLKLLNEKISQGVDVRIIGRASGDGLFTRTLPTRLHARVILRDGNSAFLGSQSLRKLELEVRREIGIILHDRKTVKRMTAVFDRDWSSAAPAIVPDVAMTILDAPAKKVAKAIAKKIRVAEKVEAVLDKVATDSGKEVPLEPKEVVESVREAVRDEVRDAVVQAVQEMVTEAAKSAEATPPPAANNTKT
jgi:phosphatidylserine/phosphatidylglycerophosphate/cardiolipin synthase-like enzyme